MADPLCGTLDDFSASSIMGNDVGLDGDDPKMVSSSVVARSVNGGGGEESDSLASNRNIAGNRLTRLGDFGKILATNLT